MASCTLWYIFLVVIVLVWNGCHGDLVQHKDMSLYCEDIAKMTNLCNEIFTNLACPKTCSHMKVQKECGRRSIKTSANDESHERVRRIIGGEESKHGAWPWHVSLYYKGKMKCAGAILSKNWVLTAANCFDSDITSNNPADWTISAGDFSLKNTEDSEQSISVQNIIKHENNFKFWKIGYKNVPDDYDIALLKTAVPLHLNDYVAPVCLPETDQSAETFNNRDQCKIIGWGSNGNYHIHDKLHEASMKIVPRDICNLPISYNGSIHHRAICAGYGSVGADACDFDSGGALVCYHNSEWSVVGLVSWGYKCGKPTKYGVYTNIPELRSWIIEVLLGYSDVLNTPGDIRSKVKQETAKMPKVPPSQRKTYFENQN